MRLYDEIFKNADGAALSRCIILPDGGGYFEGVKTVEDFSADKIELRFPHKKVEIEGVGLTIAKYCDGDLEVGGKIRCFRVLVAENQSKDQSKNQDETAQKQGGKR